jgi:hypothetical protein
MLKPTENYLSKNFMNDLLKRIQPADIIALVIIVGVMILQFRGIQTMLSQAVLLVVGYYFGRTLKQSNDTELTPKPVVVVPPTPEITAVLKAKDIQQ